MLFASLLVVENAHALCTISSARLAQNSEREIVAYISASCSRDVGESGYYTQIAPEVFGEVMAVSGRRTIDSNGVGFQSDYGFHVNFVDSRASYQVGVWVGDADGVVHSELMSIQNSYFPTATSSTTTTNSPSVAEPAPAVSPPLASAPIEQKNLESSTSATDIPGEEGVESDYAEVTVRAIGNRWVITIDSSFANTAMTVKFRKSGQRIVTWNVNTNDEGMREIYTSRGISGGTLTLSVGGVNRDRVVVR